MPSNVFKKSKSYDYTGIIILVFFLLITFVFNVLLGKVWAEQQFSLLGFSFLNGNLFLAENVPQINTQQLGDLISWQGHYYWPEGPFPAIVLVPFIFLFKLIGLFFYQGYLQFILILFTVFFIYKICKKIGYKKDDSLFLINAFCFASMFLGVALVSWCWYYSQVVTVFLLFWSLYEFFHKKRYWLLGFIFGFLLITRVTACFGVVFFILELFFSSNKHKVKNLIFLLLPIFFMLFLLLFYNYLRFGSFFEQGYSLITVVSPLAEAMKYGLFGLVHLPGNLYYSLLAPPLLVFKDNISHVLSFPFLKNNPWGMSIFITSPYLIYLFFLQYKDRISKFLLFTAIIIAIPIFLYYGIGYRQFGYRYALDFMPFVFLLFIKNYYEKNTFLSSRMKFLIIFSSFFNLYVFFSFFKSF